MENNPVSAIFSLNCLTLSIEEHKPVTPLHTSFALLFSLIFKGELSQCGDSVEQRGSENLLVTPVQMHMLCRTSHLQTNKAKQLHTFSKEMARHKVNTPQNHLPLFWFPLMIWLLLLLRFADHYVKEHNFSN